MARIRTIKPEFWSDRKLAADLTREQRLFYIGLWNEADDQGRFLANPRRLLGELLPYDDDISEEFIEASLRALGDTHRLVLYTVGGTPYGQLTKFADHQRINRPTPSRIPPPDSDLAVPHGGLSEGSVRAQCPEVGSRNRGSSISSPSETPSKPEGAPVSDLWEVWLEELGGEGRKAKLTKRRSQALAALWCEQLREADDPVAVFRSILHAVKASDHHMGERAYQMPESLFRNPERRDTWMQKAAGNGTGASDPLTKLAEMHGL